MEPTNRSHSINGIAGVVRECRLVRESRLSSCKFCDSFAEYNLFYRALLPKETHVFREPINLSRDITSVNQSGSWGVCVWRFTLFSRAHMTFNVDTSARYHNPRLQTRNASGWDADRCYASGPTGFVSAACLRHWSHQGCWWAESWYEVATISRLPINISLFCKTAL